MGAVDTTYTFTATDTITSAKMNNIIDQTTITTDAIIGTTLDVASGKLKIRSQGITSNEMGANSVVAATITDSNVTTAKIADANITAPKLNGAQTGTAPIYGCRAWGSFDGSASTPITPSGSGNIASIVRLATASYRVTFTTVMPNDNYAVSFGSIAISQTNLQANASISLTARTSSTFDFNFVSASANPPLVTFIVIG